MEGYLVFLAIFTAVFALFSLGLNLQWGFTGLINFGHVAFMTIGAYVTALLTLPDFLREMPNRIAEEIPRRPLLIQWLLQGIQNFILLPLQPVLPGQVPALLAVMIGAGLAALLGLCIGFATLRLREDYLAIVTIGVAEIVRLVVLNEEWLTRGTFGVQGFPLPLGDVKFSTSWIGKPGMAALLIAIASLAGWYLCRWLVKRWRQKTTRPAAFIGWAILGGLSLLLGAAIVWAGTLALYGDPPDARKARLMVLVISALAVIFWQIERLVHSPWGRILKAIREDEEVPRALGKNVFWYKLQALMLGGAITGIAGSFYAWQLSSVYPSQFIPLITFHAWMIVMLGGGGNNAGTLLGAVIFWAYTASTRALPWLAKSAAVWLSFPQLAEFLDDARLGAFRVMIIGLLLIGLMVWRPQGILGKKEELTLGK